MSATRARSPRCSTNKASTRSSTTTSTRASSADLPDDAHCYFVNSYHAVPADPGHVLATTEYGVEFSSIVGRDNIVATQFHLEKSGPAGLSLLERFATLERT